MKNALSHSASMLIAEVKLCNNGYLFAPTQAQVNVAEDNPDTFTIRRGTVYLSDTFQVRFNARISEGAALAPTPHVHQCEDGPDYEAWILSSDEAFIFDY